MNLPRHHPPARPTMRLAAYFLLFLSVVAGCGAVVAGQTVEDIRGDESGTAPETGQGLLIALLIAGAGLYAWYRSNQEPPHD